MLRVFLLLLLLVIAACQPSASEPLPTLAGSGAADAEQTPEVISTPSPTSVRPTLPPTWTPEPEPTAVPTDPADVPSPTPLGFRESGTLYYIFNEQSIVELAPDGTFEDLLPIPNIGQLITDLAPALDDTQLAYVAPGSGSAREIFVTNRAGTETRQITQLGFARITDLAWRPGTNEIAFLASQAPDTPMDIYLINADGGSQRRLLARNSTEIRDLAWDYNGRFLYFSDDLIYAVDAGVGSATQPLTATTGFGPDTSPAHSPTDDLLYYLKPFKDFDTGIIGGTVTYIRTTDLLTQADEIQGAELYASGLSFSRDGQYLLVYSDNAVWVQAQATNTAFQILQDGQTAPHPVLSPDAEEVAYVNLDEAGIEQVYITTRLGEGPVKITEHQEGTITNLIWVAG